MVAYTTTYSFAKPTVGDDEDVWGGYLNGNFDTLESLLKGTTALTAINVTGNITVGGNVDGRDIAADGSKLDGIESGATADQTKADIDALNIDADTVDGIQASSFLRSDADDTTSGVITFTHTGTSPKLFLSGNGGASSYNYIIKGSNDAGTGAVHFINGSTRTTDGGASTYTIRNDIGPLRLGRTSQSTLIEGSGDLTYNGNEVWHAGNDGSGSGLDADTVDGYQASESNTASTLVARTSGGDISVRYAYSDYTYMGHSAYQRNSDSIFFSSYDGFIRKNNATGFKNSLGLGTGDSPTFSTVTADGLSVALNTDAYATIGRAHVGYMGWSDWAGFSHIDSDGQYSYALLQNPSGQTIVNAASGQSVSVNIANSNVAQWTSSYSSLQVPLYNYSIFYEDYDALSGTSVTVNTDTAQGFSLTLSGNTTFTFNSVASAWSYGFVLELSGHASSTYTVTWPTSVDWAGGTAPDAPAAGETDIYVFWTRDGGTTWYGVLSVDAAA